MSNLTYQIPEENFLLIKPLQTSDEYYGLIDDAWYGEMIKNLPRQILNVLEVLSVQEFNQFLQLTNKLADQRKFAGNMKFLRLV